MNILLRIVAVLVLLGSLAYGSYAVGRYVLSEKLFGNSIAVQPSSGLVATVKPRVTPRGKVSTNGEKSPIEVQVLPADQAENGPDVASIKDLQTSPSARRSSATPEKPKIVNANTLSQSRSRLKLRDSSGSTIFGASGVQGDDGERVSRRSRRNRDRDEERPRRRRRKRRNRSSTTTVVADASSTRSSTRSASGSDSGSDSRPSRRGSSDDSRPSRRSSSSSSDAPARSQSSSGDSGNGPF